MNFIKGYDPETLREVVDPSQCRERLEEIEEQRSLPALLERVWLLKMLDRLEEARALSEESVRVARMAGTRKDLLRARVLHATVLQHQGAHEAAAQELDACATEAEGKGWANLAAFACQHQGRNLYDAGDFEAAREAFKRSLFLRHGAGAEDRRIETALLAIDAAERRRDLEPVAPGASVGGAV
ncbi:hypothetical protein [Microbacterium sp. NIBRBAC000506063]|uniref:hypothetical protein n=1 Tax=Microbacterium sp. NIBRBAC000506063 TaxID=2734618 RepID=UPI001BB7D24E|nr:hypothetical protein [Microbacterium sp. NIBRBAC000506063]QTV80090.1 hypothetical protein KAE78_03060 [Microbacterium sp. NIBRBAC000506063]